ncbi:insulinoma-associated protein 2-like, partial [Carlito syrichta]|uniref:Insulinoma-associated protein 2 n=1 Tax=Carlito syrichta TaxID=1868482 RepID=A0A1U7V0L6_CARSF
LGLKIKEEEPGAPSRGPGGGRTPLGEFICQLCKEQYADPFALAQHRCSRIVRVEYRCPECDKVFSCPANLASHRRWHKPRPAAANAAAVSSADGPPPLVSSSSAPDAGALASLLAEGKENSRTERTADQHPQAGDSSGADQHQDSAPRQGLQVLSEPPRPCGAHFPSADIREKHRLWHAVREELLLPALAGAPPETPGPGGAADGSAQQIFSCKHCPSTFFSSPGLTRHINKCHPSESRQVLLLQMPLRPGC